MNKLTVYFATILLISCAYFQNSIQQQQPTTAKPDLGAAVTSAAPTATTPVTITTSLWTTIQNISTSATNSSSSSSTLPNTNVDHDNLIVVANQQQEQLLLAVASQAKILPSQIPKSDRENILNMFDKYFSRPRSHEDQDYKSYVRQGVVDRLQELGFTMATVQESHFEFRRRPAVSHNMISILPGKYHRTKRDRILLVGAHWDSYSQAPGVDDNGSGSVCLLEIARLISENRCNFTHTIMLVWFDYEEQGKYGSEFFVNDYLFPQELDKYNSKFIGAYIMDMILVSDKENNTQNLPLSLKSRLRDFSEELDREKNRGDFLATWSRHQWDEPLESAFKSSWTDLGNEARTFKAMRPELPQSRLPSSEERYEWKDFFRSDHASFWFPPLISNVVRRAPNPNQGSRNLQLHNSLNAILLTDLGPWRKSYQKCYHSSCDDKHFLTDSNLSFMQQVIDSLVLTLMRLAQGQCNQAGAGASALASTAKDDTTINTKPPVSQSAAAELNSTVMANVLAAAASHNGTQAQAQAQAPTPKPISMTTTTSTAASALNNGTLTTTASNFNSSTTATPITPVNGR